MLPGRCSSTEYLGRENPRGASGCQELERGKKSRLGAWGSLGLGKEETSWELVWPETTQEAPGMPPGLLVSHLALLTLPIGYQGNHPAALSPHYHASTKWFPHYQLTEFQSNVHAAPSALNTGKYFTNI